MSEQILNHILNELKGFHGRFDQIDRRFEQIDRRFEQVDSRFEQIDHRLDRFESEFKEFREETSADLKILKAGQQGIRSEMYDRFKEIKDETTAQSYSIDILNRRQLKVESDVEQMKDQLKIGS